MSQPHEEPHRGSITSTPPGTPRWVKVVGIVIAVVVLLLVIMLVAGDGHHLPSGGADGATWLIAHGTHQR